MIGLLSGGGTEVKLDSDAEETETPPGAQPAGSSLPSVVSESSRADEEPPRVGITHTSTTSTAMSATTMKQVKDEASTPSFFFFFFFFLSLCLPSSAPPPTLTRLCLIC